MGSPNSPARCPCHQQCSHVRREQGQIDTVSRGGNPPQTPRGGYLDESEIAQNIHRRIGENKKDARCFFGVVARKNNNTLRPEKGFHGTHRNSLLAGPMKVQSLEIALSAFTQGGYSLHGSNHSSGDSTARKPQKWMIRSRIPWVIHHQGHRSHKKKGGGKTP